MGEGVLGRNTVRGSIVNPAAQPVAVNAVLELLGGDGKWEALPGSKAIPVPAGGEAGFELDYDVPQADPIAVPKHAVGKRHTRGHGPDSVRRFKRLHDNRHTRVLHFAALPRRLS